MELQSKPPEFTFQMRKTLVINELTLVMGDFMIVGMTSVPTHFVIIVAFLIKLSHFIIKNLTHFVINLCHIL